MYAQNIVWGEKERENDQDTDVDILKVTNLLYTLLIFLY